MNWESIGAIGEILGALAVFVSLVYLAQQIRTNTNQSRAVMVQQFQNDFNGLHSDLLHNSQLAALFLKANRGDELSDVENLQWNSIANKLANTYLSIQTAHDNGQITEDYYNVVIRDVQRVVINNPALGSKLKMIMTYHREVMDKELVRAVVEAGSENKS